MGRRAATEEMIRRVLKDDYLALAIERYSITEDVVAGDGARVRVELRDRTTPERAQVVEGTGVGIVDALYSGMHDHYAREFDSLNTITFTRFGVQGRMETAKDDLGLSAEAVVSLTVQNSQGHSFEFEQSHRSLAVAALGVVVQAMEYFVNSERAFISVYRALCDAKERRRSDLVGSYTAQLAELVNTTSYTDVIERIKAEAL